MHKSDQQITQPHTTQASSQIFPAKFFIFLYANIVTTPQPTSLEQLSIDDKTLSEIVDNAVQTAIKAKMDKIYTKEAIEAIFALAK